eukprot:14037757-Ditylum_brightwellii.AAC.1
MQEQCFHHTTFKGIYRNSGLVIFLGKLTQIDLAKWLKDFQCKVGNLVEGSFFNFTAEIWGPDEDVEEEAMAINNQVEQI